MLLHSLLASSVERWPDAVAIDVPPGVDRPDRQQMTYAQLARCAAGLVARLQAFVGGECVVAILIPRTTPLLYAAQIAVLQVGAAHVCIDPSYPDDYVDFVLRDARPVALLTDAAGAARIGAARLPAGRVLDVHASAPDERASAPSAPPAWLADESLAYVIYTSGTTGRPKGVLLQHGGVAALIRSGVQRFGISSRDRIAQGSSPAYDSSIEETWLALAAGATVVGLDDETVRLGPDLVEWLRRERITVLCPPPTLLRAMHCRAPARELPHLRLCYAGGEAMPQDLCDLWAKDLWLENGYGPTECTVTVVRGRLQPGRKVTIGEPVPGHRAFLLDDDLQEVGPGEAGELCIAGPGLARGYLGHADLTRQRFVSHPRLGRIYRTGDLARREADGALVCLGRIDAQVKLRGHRIELEAVEAELARCAGVREAACRIQGEGDAAALVACVVPADANAPPRLADVAMQLRRQLPAQMVPAAMAVIDALPRTIGGKLDRKSLPVVALSAPSTGGAGSGDGIERRIAAAYCARLPGHPDPGPEDDFFALGGDSLRAAQVITDLRQDPATAPLTVRDLYRMRTVRGLASLARPAAPAEDVEPVVVGSGGPGRGPSPGFATALQLLWLATSAVVASGAGYAVLFHGVPWLLGRLGALPFLVLGPLLWHTSLLLYAPVALWLAVLGKELLIGSYRARAEPVWSGFYVRNWIVQRLVRLVPWRELQGTEFQNMGLRALGARIGRRVHLHRGVDLLDGGWDLLEIGDDVTLAQEVSLGLVDLDGGRLVVGAVRIGRGATLDVRAGTGPGVEIGAGALLTALSALPAGSSVPAGERWDGVPARPAGRAPDPPALTVRGREVPPLAHGALLWLSRALLAPLALLPVTLPLALLAGHLGIDAAALMAWLERPWVDAASALAGVAIAASVVPCRLLGQALLLRWAPTAPLGTSSRWAASYCRIWLRTGILQSAGIWLSGTLLWPAWLRLAGMRIGKDCEISTILDALPETVSIGGGSFLADGIYLAPPWVQAGTVTVRATRLGEGTFLGNHAVVPAGQQLDDQLVLGVSTVADDRTMRKDTGWFGHPPFRLPRREVVVVDRRLTHEPGALRWCNRLFWELLRFCLPLAPLALAAWWFRMVTGAGDGRAVAFFALVLPGASLAVAAAACILVLALKWALLGRVRPGQHGLWSCWASRWDFLYVAWGFLARSVLAQLEGTSLLAFYARAMGASIGRRVVLGHGFAQIVDPDMLHLGDGATVSALFQAHSFEDRVLKIDRVYVGDGATVAPGAVLLYGARVGDRTRVGLHSVVMKHEHLLPGRLYEGAPTAPAAWPPRGGRELAGAPPVAAAAVGTPGGRDHAVDVARGLAVLGMIWTHLVPSEGADGAAEALGAFLAGHLEAWSGVMFAVLLGMGCGLQARTAGDGAGSTGAALRRAVVLVMGGLLLGWSLWPTEILTSLGIMLFLVSWLQRGGTGVCLGAVALLLVLVPPTTACLGHFVEGDWHEDGSPAVWSTFGWVTARYFLFDGNYPLLPWLCFPLLGAAMVAAGHDRRPRALRWFWLALPAALAVTMWSQWAADEAERLGWLAPHLQSTWVPTSVPAVVGQAAAAVATIAALCWWQAARGFGRVRSLATRVAAIGRSSLTHYVLHIVLVFVPLRLWYPDEDWSIATGAMAAGIYAAIMVPCTVLWFGRWRRGPLEGLLAWAGRGLRGPTRPLGLGER